MAVAATIPQLQQQTVVAGKRTVCSFKRVFRRDKFYFSQLRKREAVL